MFQFLKDTRRRSVQTILESTGMSEKTVNTEMDNNFSKFVEMIDDMNECGATLANFLVNQKKYFSDAHDLSKSLAKIYKKNVEDKEWPDINCDMKYNNIASEYSQKMLNVHEVYRSSSAKISSELALEPMKAFVIQVGEGVGKLDKDRKTKLTDFDAHNRRHKKLENKMHSTSGLTEKEEVEFNKFASKAQSATLICEEATKTEKDTIIRAKAEHDALMDEFLLTIVVCQYELFSAATERLKSLVEQFPKEIVSRVKASVMENVFVGGALVNETKSGLQKGIDVMVGKAPPSEIFKSDKESSTTYNNNSSALPSSSLPSQLLTRQVSSDLNNQRIDRISNTTSSSPPPPPTSPPPSIPQAIQILNSSEHPSALPVQAAVQMNSSPHSNPFTSDSGNSNSYSPPSRSSRKSLNNTQPLYKVVALFDFKPVEKDELEFFTGDIIDVIEPNNDEGWSKGMLRGITGVFPSNYVKPID